VISSCVWWVNASRLNDVGYGGFIVLSRGHTWCDFHRRLLLEIHNPDARGVELFIQARDGQHEWLMVVDGGYPRVSVLGEEARVEDDDVVMFHRFNLV